MNIFHVTEEYIIKVYRKNTNRQNYDLFCRLWRYSLMKKEKILNKKYYYIWLIYLFIVIIYHSYVKLKIIFLKHPLLTLVLISSIIASGTTYFLRYCIQPHQFMVQENDPDSDRDPALREGFVSLLRQHPK